MERPPIHGRNGKRCWELERRQDSRERQNPQRRLRPQAGPRRFHQTDRWRAERKRNDLWGGADHAGAYHFQRARGSVAPAAENGAAKFAKIAGRVLSTAKRRE